MKKKQEVILALGGGGSRGVSHIGVIQELEANKIKVAGIAGTSIGSIIGTLYALGYSPNAMGDIFRKVDQTKLFGLPFSDGPGFLGYKGVKDFLVHHIGTKTFTDTHIPLKIVTTDLRTNTVEYIGDGPLVDAILSSIAIPGVFPPMVHEHRLFVDGGVLDPVPVRAARSLGIPGKIIAITLNSPRVPVNIPLDATDPNPMIDKLKRNNLSMTFKIIMETVGTTSTEISELRLQIDRPDIIIRPLVAQIGMLDQVNVEDLIERGVRATKLEMAEIKRSKNIIERFLG